MWSPFILSLLVGVTLADPGWKAGSQYNYEVRGRILTGLFHSRDQYSGINTRAKLSVQAKSDDVLSLQVHGAEYAEIHANLSNGWSSEISDEDLKYTKMPIQSEQWELSLRNGVVKEMTVQKDLPTWEVNFLKSIASLLQVDSQGENLKVSKSNLMPTEEDVSGVYKTMEDSIHGEYETSYEVSELPEYITASRPEMVPMPHLRGTGKIIEIVKNRNFSNSDKHIVYHHGINRKSNWEPASNQMGNFLARSSVSRVILTGSLPRYVIQSSVTDEKIVVAPHLHNNQKGIVASRMNLTLEGMSTAQGPNPPVKSPRKIKSLIYEINAENEKAQNDENSAESSSSSSSSSESNEMSRNSMASSEEQRIKKNDRKSSSSSSSSENSSSSSSSSENSWSSSSSESSESVSSSEENYHPRSALEDAPQTAFLPFFGVWNRERNQDVKGINILEQSIEIARQIAKETREPESMTAESTLSKFMTLTQVIRTMSAEQLKKLAEKLYVAKQSVSKSNERAQDYQAWVTLRDSVAEAGTGPALLTIKDWIKTKKVSGEEAAQIFAVLPRSANFPSEDYIRAFFEIVKDPEVQEQMWLNSSSILAFTDLVRNSMVDRKQMHNQFPVHMFGPTSRKGDESTLKEIMSHLDQKLRESVEEGDSNNIQVYTRALGNIAHKVVLASFEPYLEGKAPVSKYQRLVMVASMDKMTEVYPKEARAVLYRIYQNMGEAPEVRTAAVIQIMKTNPPAEMLQRMAQQTNQDHSKQVNAAVKSAIESAAQQPINHYNRQSVENARSAVNMLTTEEFGVHNSLNFIRSFVVKEQQLAYKHHLAHIQSSDSIIPKTAFYTLSRNLGGFKRQAHEMQYMTSSVDQLLDKLAQMAGSSSERTQRKTRGSASGSEWSLESVFETLGFENERPEQLEWNVMITALGGKRFFAFDNNTVDRLPKIAAKWSAELQGGKYFNYTKFYNQYSMEIAFSTAAGFPFIYSLNVPTVVNIGGRVKASMGSGHSNSRKSDRDMPSMGNIRSMLGNWKVDASSNVVYSAKRQGNMGFISPFNGRMYLSGLEKNLHVRVPIRASAKVDLTKMWVDATIEPLNKTHEQKIFEYSTDAFTTAQEISDLKPLKSNENTQVIYPTEHNSLNKTIGRDWHGFALDVSIEGERNSIGMDKILRSISNNDLVSLWLYPGMDEELSHSNITVVHNPHSSWAERARISIKLSGEKNQHTNKPGMNKHRRSNSRKANENLSIPTSEKKNSREELLQNAMSGIADAEGRMIDMSVSLEGKKKMEYAITMAHASGQEKSRFLAYFRNSSSSGKPFEAGLEWNQKNPKVPLVNLKEALKANPQSEVEAVLDFGRDLESRISLKAQMKSSPERKEYLRRHPLTAVCEKQMEAGQHIQPACRNMTARASYLDRYQLTISHENLPAELKNMTQKVYSVARYLWYPYHEESLSEGTVEAGKVVVNANFSSSLRKVNVSISTPSLSSKFQRVPITDWLRPILVIHPQYSAIQRLGQKMLRAQQSPICVLDGGSINTFDNSSYHVNLGNTPHVIAQSIFRNEQLRKLNLVGQGNNDYFSILASQESGNKLQINVIAGQNVLQIQPSGGKSAEFNFNGQQVQIQDGSVAQLSDEEGNEIFKISVVPEGAYQISARRFGFELIWSGSSLRLQVSNNLRGKVRGLCGNFDGESYNDFLTPKGYIVNNTQAFSSSYAILSTSERPVEGDAQEKGVKEEIILGNIISEKDYGQLKMKTSNMEKLKLTKSKISGEVEEITENKYRVKVIQEPGRTCFSLRPQLSCGSGFKASQLVDKTIDFHCIGTSSASKHWEQIVKKGVDPDFTRKGSNHRATLKLPLKCVEK